MKYLKLACAALGGLLLAGCATSIESYRGGSPTFDLQQFFSGELSASGLFIDYSGKVARRFTVTMRGSWEGDQGKLEEWFVYDDGGRRAETQLSLFETDVARRKSDL